MTAGSSPSCEVTTGSEMGAFLRDDSARSWRRVFISHHSVVAAVVKRLHMITPSLDARFVGDVPATAQADQEPNELAGVVMCGALGSPLIGVVIVAVG